LPARPVDHRLLSGSHILFLASAASIFACLAVEFNLAFSTKSTFLRRAPITFLWALVCAFLALLSAATAVFGDFE
jgi:hypothetical protein